MLGVGGEWDKDLLYRDITTQLNDFNLMLQNIKVGSSFVVCKIRSTGLNPILAVRLESLDLGWCQSNW